MGSGPSGKSTTVLFCNRKKTSYFFLSAKKLIKKIKNKKLNTEPYVSETYNFLLEKKMKIASYLLKPKNYFLIGIPKDYNLFKDLAKLMIGVILFMKVYKDLKKETSIKNGARKMK